MGIWLVRLTGNPNDLSDLAMLLSTSDPTVVEEDGNFFLKSQNFSASLSVEEIYRLGQQMAETLSGIVHVSLGSNTIIGTDVVVQVADDGKRHQFIFLRGALTATSRMGLAKLTVLDRDGNEGTSHAPNAVELLLNLTKQHPEVKDVLRFFQKDDWFSYYKVYEIIREDLGGEQNFLRSLQISKTELNRFTQTAQSSDAIGDNARHASRKFRAPPKPMSINEARRFVRRVLDKWISSK